MGKPNIIPNGQSIKMIPNDIRIYIYDSTLIREPSIYSRWFLTQRTTTTGQNAGNKL